MVLASSLVVFCPSLFVVVVELVAVTPPLVFPGVILPSWAPSAANPMKHSRVVEFVVVAAVAAAVVVVEVVRPLLSSSPSSSLSYLLIHFIRSVLSCSFCFSLFFFIPRVGMGVRVAWTGSDGRRCSECWGFTLGADCL